MIISSSTIDIITTATTIIINSISIDIISTITILRYHPDKNLDDPQAKRKFQKVSEALYHITLYYVMLSYIIV